jgi:hypothetical protein
MIIVKICFLSYFSRWNSLKSSLCAGLFVITILTAGEDVFRVPTACAQEIHTITVFIKTADLAGAGTDGNVYLSIGGREFNLDNPNVQDFERNALNRFVLGPQDRDNVVRPNLNNPFTGLKINVEDVTAFPVYIRLDKRLQDAFFRDVDEWRLELVQIFVNGSGPFDAELTCERAIEEPSNFLLSPRVGLIVYIPCHR